MLRDLLTAQRVEEAVETRRPTDLSQWFRECRFLPEDVMLDSLSELAPNLADRHRREGSARQAILREVRSRLVAGDQAIGADGPV